MSIDSTVNTFQHVLSEGSLYELIVFNVTRSNPNFRYSESPHAIRFTDKTVFVDLTEPSEPIPETYGVSQYEHWFTRVCGSDEGLRSTPTKYVGVKKIEPLTIDELNEYVIKLLLRYKDQPKTSFGEGNDNPSDDFPGAGAVKISHSDGLKGTAVEDGGFVPYGDAAGGTGEPVDPSKTSVDGRSKSEDGTEHESG
uniref:DUF223 domain-containing protein n=1 Tax=Brassica campestris TaxID=3711 RepID=M4ENU9_BRACM